MALDHVQNRLGHRMLRDKNRAAVLVGQNRGVVGPDFLGDCDDVLLVKSDQRPEHRKRADRVGAFQGAHRLGRHLSEAFPGDQGSAGRAARDFLRNPHHKPPHDDGQLVMRALVINRQLYLCEIDVVQPDRPCVGCHFRSEILHLLQGALAGIRRRIEIDRIQFQAALRHHPACDRAVDAAREKQHGLAGAAHRQPAGAGQNMRIDINFLADLHRHHDIRMMNIHLQVRIGVKQSAAERLVDLLRVHRVGLILPAAVHLECAAPVRIFLPEECDDVLLQLLIRLYRPLRHRTDADDAEHVLERIHHFLCVACALCLCKNPAGGAVHGEGTAAFLQGDPHLLHKGILEQIPVLSLDADLGIFDQE